MLRKDKEFFIAKKNYLVVRVLNYYRVSAFFYGLMMLVAGGFFGALIVAGQVGVFLTISSMLIVFLFYSVFFMFVVVFERRLFTAFRVINERLRR